MLKIQNHKINKHQLEISIAVIIIILLMIIFVIYRLQNNQSSTTATSSNTPTTSVLFGKVIAVDDPKTIKFSNVNLTFPEGWAVSNAYQGTADAQVRCSSTDPSDCRIYSITDGTNVFYISSPSVVKASDTLVFTDTSKPLTSNNEDIALDYESLTLEQRDDTSAGATSTPITNSNLYFQITGCFKEGFCVNSFTLDLNTITNQSQTAAFENFVQQLKIESI